MCILIVPNLYSRSCLMAILGLHHVLPKACLGACSFSYVSLKICSIVICMYDLE